MHLNAPECPKTLSEPKLTKLTKLTKHCGLRAGRQKKKCIVLYCVEACGCCACVCVHLLASTFMDYNTVCVCVTVCCSARTRR